MATTLAMTAYGFNAGAMSAHIISVRKRAGYELWYKFRSNSDLCLTGYLREILPGVIAYWILFDLNLYLPHTARRYGLRSAGVDL